MTKKLFLILLSIFLFIFSIFLINLVSAVKIGISPPKIEFNSSTNEKTCQKIFINTNYRQELIGNDRWTKSLLVYKNDISQYDKDAKDLGLKLEYAKKLTILDDLKKEIEVCLTAEKEGKYNGALFYNTENSIAGVGIWIFADISEEKNYISRINAKVVEAFSNLRYEKTENMLIFLPVILFVFLIILLIIKRRRVER